MHLTFFLNYTCVCVCVFTHGYLYQRVCGGQKNADKIRPLDNPGLKLAALADDEPISGVSVWSSQSSRLPTHVPVKDTEGKPHETVVHNQVTQSNQEVPSKLLGSPFCKEG